MKNTITFVSFSVLLALSLLVSANAQSITGVWQITEEKSADGKTRQVTQPSMYLFTKGYYSIIWVASDKERPAIDPSTATAAELRGVFVDSFIANAGKYEVAKGKIHFWPQVAKSPTFMHAGSNVISSYKIKGRMMWITGEEAQGYPIKDPVTLTLKRVE